MALSFIASTSSSGATVTAPASGIEPGDLLLVYQYARGTAVPTLVTPDGFTPIITTTHNPGSANLGHTSLAYKIAVGDEDGEVLTGMDGNTIDIKLCLQFRDSDGAIDSVTPSTFTQNADDSGGSDPGSQSILAGDSGTAPLIVVGGYCANGSISGESFSPAADGSILAETASDDMIFKYKLYDSSPANHTIDMGDFGVQYMVGGYIEITTASSDVADDLNSATVTVTGNQLTVSQGFDVDLNQASVVVTSYQFEVEAALGVDLNPATVIVTGNALDARVIVLRPRHGSLAAGSYPKGVSLRKTRALAPSISKTRSVQSTLQKVRGFIPRLRDL